jgi:hypothetical protein
MSRGASVYTAEYAIAEVRVEEVIEAPLPITLHFTPYGVKVMKSVIKGEIPNYGLELSLYGFFDDVSKILFTTYSKESSDPCYLEITSVENKK